MALLLGSSASAAIPNSGTFYGCYRTAGSMNLLYVLDHSVQTTCPTGMSFTTWSQGGAGVGTIFDRLDNIPQTIPAGTSLYVGLDGETSTTATQVALPMPGAVTLSHLYVKLETAFALVGSTFSVNVYDATTSTVLPFSCVFTGIVAVYTTCDDTSGTASVPSGDKVAFVLSESGLSSITPGNMEMSVQAS